MRIINQYLLNRIYVFKIIRINRVKFIIGVNYIFIDGHFQTYIVNHLNKTNIYELSTFALSRCFHRCKIFVLQHIYAVREAKLAAAGVQTYKADMQPTNNIVRYT